LARKSAAKSVAWSAQRRDLAQRIASVVYGVIAITTADLVVQPDNFRPREAVEGALLIGLAMTVTRTFVRIVTRETETGKHLPIAQAGAILSDSMLVMLFPTAAALGIAAASFTAARSILLLDAIFYAGIASIFAIGFLSRYILDHQLWPALSRGGQWTILSLILLAAKWYY